MATKGQVAQLIVTEAKKRNHTRDECLAEMSALYQESQWDETVWGPKGQKITYGIAQQDASYPKRADGAAAQIKAFFDKLDVKRKSPGHGDIWLNICWLQQAPNYPSAQYWWDNPLSRRAYLTEIKSRIATVTPYLDKYWPTTGGNVVPDNRPDFNEFPFFLSGNSNDRNVANVDLWLLHTQEPPKGSDNRNDAALELRNFLESTKDSGNPVSYHYAGSQANDGGTTVVDCVDTDEASWAVGDSNGRSINFCFAGSRSDWTRQEWLDNERGTIEAAAYLFVQDCAKYPKLKARVIAPKYSDPPGAADHRYCTDFLKDGNNHTDVGPNFPWDVFAAAVQKYATGDATPPAPAKPTPVGPADEQLTLRWNCLGGQTLIEAVAELRDIVLGKQDRDKAGAL